MIKALLLYPRIDPRGIFAQDFLCMHRILSKGHDVFVHGQGFAEDGMHRIDEDELEDLIQDERNLLVYFYAGYWKEGEEILDRTRAKVTLRDSPRPWKADPETGEREGVFGHPTRWERIRRLLERYPKALWVGHSSHDLVQAGLAGRANALVLPPFNRVETWGNISPDEEVLKSLIESETVHLLSPGNGPSPETDPFLFEILDDYIRHYKVDVKLHLIRKANGGLHGHRQEVKESIVGYDLREYVTGVDESDEAALLSYYLGCDFFISASPLEGFCIPLVEAQSLCLPAIARRTSTNQEILGPKGILLDGDVREFSSAIHVLSKNRPYLDYIVEKGLENFRSRFANSIIEGRFLHILKTFRGSSE